MAFDKKVYNRKWHVENRDKNAERHRKWRMKNPDKDAVYNKRWRDKNQEKLAVATRRWYLKRNFGLSVTDYDDMLAKQKGLCAICSRPPDKKRRLAVDHCHKTKKVRGLLCLHCNRGIGLFQDDPEKLISASKYLKESI